MKPLPPFGAEFLRARAIGPVSPPELVVCTGPSAWDAAADRRAGGRQAVVLPPGHAPEDYRWSLAAGLDVLVVGFPDAALSQRIGYQCLLAGAQRIVIVRRDFTPAIYRRDDVDAA